MSVAVVIPLHNGARWIEATLASVRAQERPADELVVVDDASSDGSGELAVRAGARVLPSTARSAAGARNLGLAATRSDRVAFLDQDDLWHPAHLRLLDDVLHRHPEASAVASRIVHFPDGESPHFESAAGRLKRLDPWSGVPVTLSGLQTPSALLIRRAALDELGGYSDDAACRGVADMVLYAKLARVGEVLRIAGRTVGRRVHAGAYSQALRQTGAAFVEAHVQAGRELLAWSRARSGPRPRDEAIERRCAALQHFAAAVAAALASDVAACRDSALALEGALAGESGEFVAKLTGKLVWAHFPDGPDGTQRRRALSSALASAWPGGASRTRSSLQAHLAG